MGRALALLVCAATVAVRASANGLVGPGAVAPYSGGGQRARRYGYVRDPAAGFFVTGSTLRGLNGVYQKRSGVPGHIHGGRSWAYAYEHQSSGWWMGLVQLGHPRPTEPHIAGKDSEWVIVDGNGVQRFGHEGATVIPVLPESFRKRKFRVTGPNPV